MVGLQQNKLLGVLMCYANEFKYVFDNNNGL